MLRVRMTHVIIVFAISCAHRRFRRPPIAEGFGRYAHRDFARFCDIAVGSLTETESHLKVARRHGYVGVEDYKALLFLIRRARTATIRLKAYLRRTLTPD